MKQAALNDTAAILRRIEIIEREVVDLKLSVIKKLTPSVKKIVSLKGIIKGVDISEVDIEQAKKSLYGKVKTD